ncbi:hypothetical protein MIMGU_mgv11b016759mg [Erythranthe guttata]|uniref:Protein kinase domain-containing protein n=1 Tax=Erythranthe guttata TaxID=4155 RepID=A0A022RPD7_ERYGU|nr:hypothetical protein MIMGU_mgv11b016759mg [Erythranthe guttata]
MRKKNESLDPIEPSSGNFKDAPKDGSSSKIAAKTFTFREMAAATKNFRGECLLGEGGFGRVYKGQLEASNQVVAIKQLDRNGLQGNREFLVEVLMLSLLHHPNLVNLIGYCADGDQRLLVYELPKIGVLRIPPIRIQKISIFFGNGIGISFSLPKKIGSFSEIADFQTEIPLQIHCLARPLFKDKRKFAQIADPALQGQYPARGLYQALAIAAMCVQEQPNMRPVMADVVTALTYLSSQKYDQETGTAQNSRWGPGTPPRTNGDADRRRNRSIESARI